LNHQPSFGVPGFAEKLSGLVIRYGVGKIRRSYKQRDKASPIIRRGDSLSALMGEGAMLLSRWTLLPSFILGQKATE